MKWKPGGFVFNFFISFCCTNQVKQLEQNVESQWSEFICHVIMYNLH